MNNFQNYQALKKVIESGDYHLQGDAIVKVASLIQWLSSIEDTIRKMDAPQPPPVPVIKKLGGDDA